MSFFRPNDRVLITGDAVVTVKMDSLTGLLRQRPGLSGYTTWNRRLAWQSIQRLARLDPTVRRWSR